MSDDLVYAEQIDDGHGSRWASLGLNDDVTMASWGDVHDGLAVHRDDDDGDRSALLSMEHYVVQHWTKDWWVTDRETCRSLRLMKYSFASATFSLLPIATAHDLVWRL